MSKVITKGRIRRKRSKEELLNKGRCRRTVEQRNEDKLLSEMFDYMK